MFARSSDLLARSQSRRSPFMDPFPDPLSPSTTSNAAETNPPSTTVLTLKRTAATALRVPALSVIRIHLHHHCYPVQLHRCLHGLRGLRGHCGQPQLPPQLPSIKITQVRPFSHTKQYWNKMNKYVTSNAVLDFHKWKTWQILFSENVSQISCFWDVCPNKIKSRRNFKNSFNEWINRAAILTWYL